MGSASKVVLVGAASLVVGIYGISLKMIQGNDIKTSLSRSTRVQNERTEDAAVRAVLDRVTRSPYLGKYSMSGTVTALGGGTFNYNYTTHTSWGTATLTMSQNADKDYGDAKIIDVTMYNTQGTGTGTNPGFRHITRGQWHITKYHARELF